MNPPVFKTEGFSSTSPLVLLTALSATLRIGPTNQCRDLCHPFLFPPAEPITSTAGNTTLHDVNPLAALHRFTSPRRRPNFQTEQHLAPCPVRGQIRPAPCLTKLPDSYVTQPSWLSLAHRPTSSGSAPLQQQQHYLSLPLLSALEQPPARAYGLTSCMDSIGQLKHLSRPKKPRVVARGFCL